MPNLLEILTHVERGPGRGLAWPLGDEPDLINVSTRKLKRAVRLPQGDLPVIVGDGTSKSAASRPGSKGVACPTLLNFPVALASHRVIATYLAAPLKQGFALS